MSLFNMTCTSSSLENHGCRQGKLMATENCQNFQDKCPATISLFFIPGEKAQYFVFIIAANL